MNDTPTAAPMREDVTLGDRFQHLKRGTEYEVIGLAELQMACDVVDGSALVVYRGNDGRIWAREEGEFLDGRFVRLNHTARSDAVDDKAEIERLRGLLIDPGSPPWEDARAVLVAELRKARHSAAAYQVSNGQGCEVPSHIALNLIAQAARRPNAGDAIDNAADIIDQYAGYIATVKADELEQHPYLPSVEQAAQDLRAALSRPNAGDGAGRLQAVWDAQPDLPPIEFTPAEEAAIYAAFQAASTSNEARASRHSTLEARVSHVGAGDGYATAFYEIATMLGIGAQAAPPADVWRDQMRPKLEALTTQRAPAGGEKAALLQEAASLIYRVASAGAIAHEGVAFERWKNTARDLAPRLTAALAPTAEPAGKASRFDPPGLWESEPRSSADDAGKAGQ